MIKIAVSIFVITISVLQETWSHENFLQAYTRWYGQYLDNINWDPEKNGDEETYMEYTKSWKKEIVSWAKECINEIGNKMYQLDQINWAAADDLRHQIGITIGRILELHRQQVDMFRRMKRIVDNRFNWLRPELSNKFPQLAGQDAVVEPSQIFSQFNPEDYNREWAKSERKVPNDYKPHVYMLALEYITKRETDIEHLVKSITRYTGEEEVDRFKPRYLVADQDNVKAWDSYSTGWIRPYAGYWRRHGTTVPEYIQRQQYVEEKKQEEEEELKAKMREEYFKKAHKNQ